MENALPSRQALENLWRGRLQIADSEYRAAREAVVEARELHSQIPSPDGNLALSQALLGEKLALAEYRRVLTIFTDLLVDGTIPAEDDYR
jgi:hypothetical protein